jgi:alpha-1,3-rhamnosyl/mannosyltransferase
LASGNEFKQRNKEELSQFLRDIGLEFEGYSLFIGTIEPRKNLNALLDAYSKLSLTTKKKWPLIIAGFSGWSSDDLHLRMLKAQQEGWLRYLGYLPNKNLPLLMAGARLFVYPSLYEGFGLPVIEAMASGVPVVCSNASCLPEVAGDAALFHKAEDIDELNNLLSIGLEDDFKRKKIMDLGCGYNPFSYKYLLNYTKEKLEYVAIDINSEDSKFIQAYFDLNKIKGKALTLDLSKEENQKIVKEESKKSEEEAHTK